MSIRFALFSGIIALLLVMAISQTALIYGFKQRLQQEITEQSTELTRVVLQMTAEKLQAGSNNMQRPAEVKQQVKIIELEKVQGAGPNLQNQLQQQLLVLTSKDPQQLKTWHLKTDRGTSPLIADFMRYTLLMIGISTVIAILLALYLAHRFIRPLGQLVAGFRCLQQGQLGQTITEQGLKEYRYVAQQFNQMSTQLAQLAAQAEQAQQQ